jgi:hypothetical protein
MLVDMLSTFWVVPSPTSWACFTDSFNASISCLCLSNASVSAFFLCFSSFCSQYDSNFTLTMSRSRCSSMRSEASSVMFYSSIACSNSSQGIWFATLNLSFSRSGTGSSSFDSTIGSEADMSFDFVVSL